MEIRARVPGAVESILVKEGDHVEVKDVLVKLEAMKMVQSVLTPKAGEVSEILVEEGDRVKSGQVIMTIEED